MRSRPAFRPTGRDSPSAEKSFFRFQPKAAQVRHRQRGGRTRQESTQHGHDKVTFRLSAYHPIKPPA